MLCPGVPVEIGVCRNTHNQANIFLFCVACVAWQTHKDHIVRPRCLRRRCRRQRRRRRRRRHTFHFRSTILEEMYGFHSNFAELYISIQNRSSSILVLIRQIFAELWPFFWLSFCGSFPLNNFCRDALISFKLCRTLYQHKIQVTFNIGNHPPTIDWVMTLFSTKFLLVCWYWLPINNFRRDALILLKVCRRIYHCKTQVKFDISNYPQIFGWVMSLFFDLIFVGLLILVSA